MISLAFRQVLAKKVRSLLTVLGVGVCVNLYIVVSTVMRFITEDLDLQIQRFAGLVFVQSRGEAGMTGREWPPVSSTLSATEARTILASPHVRAEGSAPVAFAALAPPPFPTAPPEALLVGVEPGREAAFLGDAPALLGSNRLIPGARRDQVILGVLAARHFAPAATATVDLPSPVGPISLAAVGSRITVRGREFEVLGIMEPETNQLLRSCVVVPLAEAQALKGTPDAVSALIVQPNRASDIRALQAEIARDHPALMVLTNEEMAENANRLLDQVTQLFNVVRVTAVTVAALLITIVMFVAVLERTREIGTLRAIGAPARSIFALILAESFMISLAGAALGVPLSREVITRALGPDAAGIRSGRREASAATLLTTFGMVAALLPAVRAVRVDPIVALRYD